MYRFSQAASSLEGNAVLARYTRLRRLRQMQHRLQRRVVALLLLLGAVLLSSPPTMPQVFAPAPAAPLPTPRPLPAGAAVLVRQTAPLSSTTTPTPTTTLPSATPVHDTRPTLPFSVTARFAPDAASPPAAPLPAGTRYGVLARAGWAWVQLATASTPPLWVATEELHNPTLNLAALPNLTPPPFSIAYPPEQVQAGEHTPRTPAAAAAYFAPDLAMPAAHSIPAGTPYELWGRYQQGWVQADIAGYGMLWLEVGALGVQETDLAALPNHAPTVGYLAYTVQAGDTLASIAALGGSDATAIASLNRVADPLVVGRPLIVPLLAGGVPQIASTANVIKWGNRERRYVALTVDVEYGDATAMLDVLRQHGVRATMFVLAGWAQAHPQQLCQMLADGHELGNHSVTHRDFRHLSDAEMIWELGETERIVQEACGGSTRPYFRPPYGGYDVRVVQVAATQGYLTLFWGVDSQDALLPYKSADYVTQMISGAYAPDQMPGMISLSHCCAAHLPLPQALPAILANLQAQGLEPRPLSEVLGQ